MTLARFVALVMALGALPTAAAECEQATIYVEMQDSYGDGNAGSGEINDGEVSIPAWSGSSVSYGPFCLDWGTHTMVFDSDPYPEETDIYIKDDVGNVLYTENLDNIDGVQFSFTKLEPVGLTINGAADAAVFAEMEGSLEALVFDVNVNSTTANEELELTLRLTATDAFLQLNGAGDLRSYEATGTMDELSTLMSNFTYSSIEDRVVEGSLNIYLELEEGGTLYNASVDMALEFSAHCSGDLVIEGADYGVLRDRLAGYDSAYENNRACGWVLKGATRWYATSFELDDPEIWGCVDSVTVYDGTDSSGRNLGIFCTTDAARATGQSGDLYIEMYSDSSTTASGFVSVFTTSGHNDLAEAVVELGVNGSAQADDIAAALASATGCDCADRLTVEVGSHGTASVTVAPEFAEGAEDTYEREYPIILMLELIENAVAANELEAQGVNASHFAVTSTTELDSSGVCVYGDSIEGKCYCHQGFTGDSCDSAIPALCDEECVTGEESCCGEIGVNLWMLSSPVKRIVRYDSFDNTFAVGAEEGQFDDPSDSTSWYTTSGIHFLPDGSFLIKKYDDAGGHTDIHKYDREGNYLELVVDGSGESLSISNFRVGPDDLVYACDDTLDGDLYPTIYRYFLGNGTLKDKYATDINLDVNDIAFSDLKWRNATQSWEPDVFVSVSGGDLMALRPREDNADGDYVVNSAPETMDVVVRASSVDFFNGTVLVGSSVRRGARLYAETGEFLFTFASVYEGLAGYLDMYGARFAETGLVYFSDSGGDMPQVFDWRGVSLGGLGSSYGALAESRRIGIQPGPYSPFCETDLDTSVDIVAGSNVSFSVSLKTATKQVWLGGSTLTVTITGTTEIGGQDVEFSYDIDTQTNGDGTASAWFQPLVASSYSMAIKLTERFNDHIAGSPFDITVVRADTDAATSLVSGAGLTQGVAGFPTVISMVALDEFGNERGVGGDDLRLALDGVEVDDAVTDNGDGTYEIEFSQELSSLRLVVGIYIRVGDTDHHVALSPYTIVMLPGTAVAAESGIADAVEVSLEGESTFSIVPRDEFGNQGELDDTQAFEVSITLQSGGSGAAEIAHTLEEQGDGTWLVTYTAAGNVLVDVTFVEDGADDEPVEEGYLVQVLHVTEIYEPDEGLRAAIMAVAALAMVALGGFAALIWHWRDHMVIKMSQRRFCLIIVLGGFVSLVDVFVRAPAEPTDASCVMSAFLRHMSLAIMFGSLFAKTYRVHIIMNNKQLRKVTFSNTQVMMLILKVVAVFGAYMAVWFVVDPPVVALTDGTLSTRGAVSVTTLSETCESDDGFWLSALTIAEGVFLLAGCYLAYVTRDCGDAMAESRHIGHGIYNILFISAVVLGVVSGTGDALDTDAVFIVESLGTVAKTMSTLVIIFVPKFLFIKSGKTISLDGQNTQGTQKTQSTSASAASYARSPSSNSSGTPGRGGTRRVVVAAAVPGAVEEEEDNTMRVEEA